MKLRRIRSLVEKEAASQESLIGEYLYGENRHELAGDWGNMVIDCLEVTASVGMPKQ